MTNMPSIDIFSENQYGKSLFRMIFWEASEYNL